MSHGSLFDLSAYGDDTPENLTDSEQGSPEETTEVGSAEPAAVPSDMVGASTAIDPTPSTERFVAASAPTALYRKYRPQTFNPDEHFGQEHIVNTLRNAIALDRIAHAYLFCGPRGTGKTSTARILAKAVNCEDPDPLNRPCNKCASCIAISTGATTDVIEIDAASNRGIDDIRDLRERVKYAPTQLRTKFYIIDEAHQITGAAANAFLKTLEEPPAHTKFVLATTDPEDLLQTIVSRCQRFDFRRISLDAIVANLSRIAEAESIDIDEEAKLMIARHATGSLRDAQGLLDQVAVYRENADDTNTTVTVELVRTVLGVSRNDRVEQIAVALADRDAAAGVRAIGDAVAAGDDVRQLARQLLVYMRELLLERSGGQSDLDATGRQLASRFDLADLAELVRSLGDIDFKAKHASIAQLPLEIAIIEGAIRGSRVTATPAPTEMLPQTSPTPMPARPAGRGGSLADRVRSGTRQNPQNPPAADPRSEGVTHHDRMDHGTPTVQSSPSRTAQPSPPTQLGGEGIERIRNLWGKVKADASATNIRMGALLSEMDPAALEGDTLILTAPYPFHASRMNEDETRLMVEQILSRVMNKPLTISCLTTDEYRQRPRSAAPPPAAVNSVASAPIVVEQPSVSEAPTAYDVNPATEPDLTESLQAVKNLFDAEEFDPEMS